MRMRDPQNRDIWYQNLAAISKLQSSTRYSRLFDLHVEIIRRYIDAIENLSEDQAQEKSNDIGDVRTKAGVVAHIMAWEEWQNQVFATKDRNVLIEQINMRGYVDPQTHKVINFSSVNEFNAYQNEKYKLWTWKNLQKKAVDQALQLKSYFPQDPEKDWIEFLENTPKHIWKITSKHTITIPSGFFLWMISLEHEAIEHAQDLY